jgi:parallel beta-helix repeat protein
MKKITIILGIILAISVVSGSCYAQNYANSLIWGCVQKNKGNLRIVDGPNSCNPSEVAISWNGNGPGVPVSNSVTVDCSSGQTISQALQQIPGDPLTITVKGTCNENVVIIRDDVTLIGDPSGGGINGIDPNSDTINVRASRTVINGLTVTGKRSGINVGGGATIQNCTIQNTGRIGIVFYHGGHGTVDQCVIQANESYGIYIEGASATVTNSTISSNATGIMVQFGGARIGITDRSQYAGNTISNNQGDGIHISHSGSASIGGNTINGNGININSVYGPYGIHILDASANLVGNNTITGNSGSGVFAEGSHVYIGNAAWGLAYHNTITANGTSSSASVVKGGVYGYLGSSLYIQNADISGNTGPGLTLNARSTARVSGSTINNNTDDGILLLNGGGLLLRSPAVTVTGNTLFGLGCLDNESSFTGDASGISGNTGGQVGCSGF